MSEFETIKDMQREDLEYAYYGAKVKYREYENKLKEIRNLILELDDETDDTTCFDIESSIREELLHRIDEALGGNNGIK